MNSRAIGIFDSGMGGLTVRAEIARALPAESLIYFGDGANVPYGSKTHEQITEFVDGAVRLLIDREIKMLVVACNAATGAAIDHLRATYDIPIIGMEPAVKPAALSTETGVIGVLATAAALKGEIYKTTAARHREKVEIIERVGEGFVELVENDHEETPQALETVKAALEPMLENGADRIVLGCTHYPFLAATMERIITEHAAKTGNAKAQIVDSAPAIARRVEQLLTEKNLHADPTNAPKHEFLSFAGEEYTRRLRKKCNFAI